MSFSVKPLLHNLHNMSAHLQDKKNELKFFSDELSFLKKIKDKMVRDLQSDNRLNWEEEPNRALLDRLYDKDPFNLYERIYRFDDVQKAIPLVQDIEEQLNNGSQELENKRNIVMQKQSNLDQYHNEILRIINQLSQCMSIVNR